MTPLLFITIFVHAQTGVMGKWTTIHDETGEVMAEVEVFERNGSVYGRILKISSLKNPDPVCNECPEDDARFGKKVIGMEIIKDLKKSGNYYGEGSILDPKGGRIYRCKIWMDGKNLIVRGYWGPFYRTQTWIKSS